MKFTPKINKAIQVAAICHKNMIRKGDGTPYISHPFAVAMIVAQYTNDEDIICAALLHDVLEDVSEKIYSKKQMKKDFGPRVVEIVEGVSEEKDASMSKAEEKRTWIERKKKYLKNLEEDSKGSLMVCAADKIHNMQSTIDAYQLKAEEIWEVFNTSKENKLWFHTEVTKIIEKRLKTSIVKELKMLMEEYRALINKKGKTNEIKNDK